ncbi:hypothetical protein IID10_06700 [candidate division KSB1 bacterium]|nr:hypothetical protein [candidate division KSB1 bacterium]
MANLWDDIARTIREGVDTVVEKTEELTRIGRIKVDILNIKRNVEKNFSELGGRVYQLISKEKNAAISTDKEAKEIIECIKILEKELDDKKSELAKVKSKPKQSGSSKEKSATMTQAKKASTKEATRKAASSNKTSSPKAKTPAKK